MYINPVSFNTNNKYRQNNTIPIKQDYAFNNVRKSPTSVSFKGVWEFAQEEAAKANEKLQEVAGKVKSSIESNWSGLVHFFKDKKTTVTEKDISFISVFSNNEEDINQKYNEEIKKIEDPFIDWGGKTKKQKQNLQNQKEAALQAARKLQQLFEEKEEELLQMKKEALELAKMLNLSIDVIYGLEDKIVQSEKRQAINKQRTELYNKSGFNKISGYNGEKLTLTKMFINKLDDEKSGKFLSEPPPNAILFFGPTGCGKTTFAKALIEETDCNPDKIKSRGANQQDKENNFIDDLHQKLEQSQTKFLDNNVRTIILIDEFDKLFNNSSPRFVSKLKSIMTSCSQEYHATLFLTTNNPRLIPYELLADHRCGIKVSLEPPNEENMTQVLQHYLCNSKDLDYEKITAKLSKFLPDEAYSNSHIKAICDQLDGTIPNTQDVLDAIEEYDKSSDNIEYLRISKYYLEEFNKDKKEIL